MSAQKPRNPEIDFGFHIVLPRILRTDYKNLSIAQKWLYTCLKDLCGEKGTCYRSLRALSEETALSTGMLSESIPVLQKAGLIHAEKKKRSQGGKEVWHITIVDIWALNAKKHPTKRSHSEQTQDKTSENVHSVNNNVQYVNDTPQECSLGERECSLSETEVITVSNNSNEAITIEEENARVSNDTSLTHPLVFHPLHNFIALDDAIAPKVMTVFMTCNEYYSEYEDKSRERIAVEVQADLKKRGHHVTFKWEKEDPASFKFAPEVIDAAPSTPPESEKTEQGNEQTTDTKQAELPIATGSQKNDAPAEPPNENQGKRKGSKGSRSTKDVPPELRERVDAFYAFLDEWRQEVMDDPDEGYNRTPTSDAAICKLLQSKKPPTRERFRIHLDEMWKEPKNERTGWHTRKKMGSIPFICKEYEERCMAVSANEQKQKGKVTSPSVNLNTVAAVAGYTQKEAEKALNPEPVEELPYAGPARLRNKRGA